MNRILSAALLVAAVVACTGKSGDNGAMNKESVKLEQYIVEGQQLYLQYCSNCHQANGQGLAKLYPPLNNSDFLENNIDSVVCIIKNGLNGPIVVNGVEYNQLMPANYNLTALEIAEITTYIYNSWGREDGLIKVTDVEKKLRDCATE